MAAQRRTERCAYRARWRAVPTPRRSPPPSSTALAPNRRAQRQDRALPPASRSDRSTSIMARTTFPGPATSGINLSGRRRRQPAGSARATVPVALVSDLTALDLPRLFSPLQAAGILRRLGLTEMTECALRTRAYRRQIPFHRNGRRIQFTASDLREIAEGQAHRPDSTGAPRPPVQAARSAPAPKITPRRSTARTAACAPVAWRARPSVSKPTRGRENSR
jgi:hypothetical protein